MAFDVEAYKESILDFNESSIVDFKGIKFATGRDELNRQTLALCLISDAESLLTKMMITSSSLSYLSLDDYASIQGVVSKQINKNSDDVIYVFPATVHGSEDVVGILLKSNKLTISTIADKMIQIIRLITLIK
jgi:hypothetical protein